MFENGLMGRKRAQHLELRSVFWSVPPFAALSAEATKASTNLDHVESHLLSAAS